MKDLRFIFFSGEEINASSAIRDNKKLVELIKNYNETGKNYNAKYSLVQNINLRTEFKINLKTKNFKYPGHWSKFKELFLEMTSNCPICSTDIQRYGAIDHYRPKQKGYWWLAYDYENYQILCSDCNSAYKGTKFPILETKVEFKDFVDVKSLNELEKPLLFNPLFQNPADYFKLRIYKKINTIEIVPCNNDSSSFEYQVATETIKIYNLDCKKDEKFSSRVALFRKRYFPIFDCAIAKDKFKKTKTKDDFLKYKKQEKRVRQTLAGSWITFLKTDNYEVF